MYPWQDYSGRLSPLKLAVFVALFLPALWTAFAFGMGWLQPRAFTEAIHQVGLWMLRFLFIALAITPLRQIVQWPRLILVRRMIGVAGFAYGLVHITLYVADLKFDIAKAASEIALRIYLTIGFAALGLAVPVLTALGEAVYFWLALGVDPMRVLSANWSLVVGWRPAAIVLALGLAVTAIGAGRALAPLIGKRLPRFA